MRGSKQRILSFALSALLLLVSLFSFINIQIGSASASIEVALNSTGSIQVIPTPSPTPVVIPTPSPSPGLLRTSGTHIVDSNGNQFYLVGAAADHNEWSKGYFTSADVSLIKQNGGNIIEIHTVNFYADLMPTKNILNAAFLTNTLDPLVNLITGQGVYCIINMQDLTTWSTSIQNMPNWMMDGHGYGSAPYSVATQQQAFKDFLNVNNALHNDNRAIWLSVWANIANRYKNNPYVIFSPMNEPMNGISFATADRPVWGQYYATFMESTVDAIRATGAQQLIFVDKPYSASEWSDIKKVNRPNIVWEDHYYVQDNHDISWWYTFVNQMVITYVQGFGQPLFIGEYGAIPLNRANWRVDMANMVAYLADTTKFSGRVFHSWGMLYGEYSSVTGNTGALTDASQNEALITTIFANTAMPSANTAMPSANTANNEILFGDGFESRTFDNFNRVYGSTSTIVSTAHDGLYAASFAQNGNYAQASLPVSSEISASCYVRWNTVSKNGYFMFLKLFNDLGGNVAGVYVFNDAGTIKWGVGTPTSYRTSNVLTNPLVNTWYFVEVQMAAGQIHVRVDGVELTDITYNAAIAVNGVRVGQVESNTVDTINIVDSLLIA
jgi:hypothetical protein